MSALLSTIEIDRPPDEVFAYLTDPTRFPEWQSDVVSVRMEDGPSGTGSRFATTRRIAGTERTMTQEVSEYSPPTRWVVRGVAGPIRPSAGITVEPLDGGRRSEVTFMLSFEGSGIGVPLLPVIRRIASRGAPVSYRTVKKLLEDGAALR